MSFLLNIALSKIEPDPGQPRKSFTDGGIKDLADSIRDNGLITPLTVRTKEGPPGNFILIAGERRFRALHLNHDGTIDNDPAVPCLVMKPDDMHQVRAAQIAENLQREGLALSELAAGVANLVQRVGNGKAAEMLSKDAGWVSRVAGITKLHADVRALVDESKLTDPESAHILSEILELDKVIGQDRVKMFRVLPTYREFPPSRRELRQTLDSAKQTAKWEAEKQAKLDKLKADNAEALAEIAALPKDQQQEARIQKLPEELLPNWDERFQRRRYLERATETPEDRAEREQQAQAYRDRETQQPARKQAVLDAASQSLGGFLALFRDWQLIDSLPPEANKLDGHCADLIGFPSYKPEATKPSDIDEDSADQDEDDYEPPFVRVAMTNDWQVIQSAAPIESLRFSMEFDNLTPADVKFLLQLLGGQPATPAPAAPMGPEASVIQHLEAATQPSPGGHIKAGYLYEHYATWCQTQGIAPLNVTEWGIALTRHGVTKRKTKTGAIYEGITMRPAGVEALEGAGPATSTTAEEVGVPA